MLKEKTIRHLLLFIFGAMSLLGCARFEANPQPAISEESTFNPNPVTPDDYFSTAAHLLGMSRGELLAALGQERSMAQLAVEKNVDPQTIVDALVAADLPLIEANAKETGMDAAQIAQWKAESIAFNTKLVNEPLPPEALPDEGDLPLNMDEFTDPFDFDIVGTLAKTIGLEPNELLAAVEGGQTITDLAQAHGISPEQIVDALMAAQREALDRAVAAGKIGSAEAGDWLAKAPEIFTEMFTENLLLPPLNPKGGQD